MCLLIFFHFIVNLVFGEVQFTGVVEDIQLARAHMHEVDWYLCEPIDLTSDIL